MRFDFISEKLDWKIQNLDLGSTVSFLNPYSYMLTRRHNLLSKIDYYGIDGILLVLIFRASFKKKIERTAFDMTSMAPILYGHAIANNASIYFVGSTEENINSFIQIVKRKYPKLNVIGYRNGFFSSKEDRDAAEKAIIELNSDFVVAGLGSPLQEEFIISLKNKGYKGISFTCGGYIHQATENIKNFPDIINRFHLRWLYRIYKEPKMFKRYFFEYPKAFCWLFVDRFF